MRTDKRNVTLRSKLHSNRQQARNPSGKLPYPKFLNQQRTYDLNDRGIFYNPYEQYLVDIFMVGGGGGGGRDRGGGGGGGEVVEVYDYPLWYGEKYVPIVGRGGEGGVDADRFDDEGLPTKEKQQAEKGTASQFRQAALPFFDEETDELLLIAHGGNPGGERGKDGGGGAEVRGAGGGAGSGTDGLGNPKLGGAVNISGNGGGGSANSGGGGGGFLEDGKAGFTTEDGDRQGGDGGRGLTLNYLFNAFPNFHTAQNAKGEDVEISYGNGGGGGTKGGAAPSSGGNGVGGYAPIGNADGVDALPDTGSGGGGAGKSRDGGNGSAGIIFIRFHPLLNSPNAECEIVFRDFSTGLPLSMSQFYPQNSPVVSHMPDGSTIVRVKRIFNGGFENSNNVISFRVLKKLKLGDSGPVSPDITMSKPTCTRIIK